MFNEFVPTCEVAFRTTHIKNKICWFDTEGFVPVSSLCGVVGSPYWFTKCLIGRTEDIWPVVYMNRRFIYTSKTCACTIIECEIVNNVCHITSTWPFISWWYGPANDSHTTHTERPSWNSLEVNCVPASVWTISISHQPNPSDFLICPETYLVFHFISGDIFHYIKFWNLGISIHN